MTKYVYIATVGQTKQPIIDGFHFKPFDYYYLITNNSPPKNRTDKTKPNPLDLSYEIKDMIHNLYGKNRTCEIYEVDFMDFESTLNQIIDIWKKHKNDEIVVNITGGTKIMVSGALIGSYVIGARIIYLKEAKEGEDLSVSERIIELPNPKVPVNDLGETHKKIIKIIDMYSNKRLEKATTVLAEKLKLKKPTISSHLQFLEKNNLIKIQIRGRKSIVELTPSGRLIARFLE